MKREEPLYLWTFGSLHFAPLPGNVFDVNVGKVQVDDRMSVVVSGKENKCEFEIRGLQSDPRSHLLLCRTTEILQQGNIT
jgi:hypothetical protein